MADKTGKGLPDVSEPKVGPERLVHEKEVSTFDMRAFNTLSIAGALCGLCMWGAFSWVGGELNLESLPGAIFGGLVSGWAIFALT